MRKTFKFLTAAAVIIMAAASCSKEDIPSIPNAGADLVKISVKGVLGEYQAEQTKSSLVNNIRVAWSEGDKVLVFDQKTALFLGELTAGIADMDDREALLSGNIQAPEGTQLSFIHGTGLSASELELSPGESTTTSVSLSLASQGAHTPFMVFGEANISESDISDLVVHFKFASSVVSTYITGLPADATISSIHVNGINTKCNISTTDLGLGGSDSGTIVLTAPGKTNAKGQAYVEIAVPISLRAKRSAVAYVDGTPYACTFSNANLSNGYSYNTILETIEGNLGGLFSISSEKMVQFSKGNLQAAFDGSAYSWGFANNQYDYIGGTFSPSDYPEQVTGNNRIASQAAGDKVDLFGWVGTSSAFLDFQKYGISNLEYDDRGHYGTSESDQLKADWGTAIDGEGTWRTLTSAEWKYLLEERSNAVEKVGFATVNGSYGIILLPDSFKDPQKQGASANASFVPMASTEWNANTYTAENWNNFMEPAGAVFLPTAGLRIGDDVDGLRELDGYNGFYWTSTLSEAEKPYALYFFHNAIYPDFSLALRYYGHAVRLVTDAK